MFSLTAAAAEQIRHAAANQSEDSATAALRVAAKIEDGEIVYGMGFDEQREQDEVIESGGVRLLIAPPSRELLNDTTLDFVELHAGEFQFIFINNSSGCAPNGGASGAGAGGGGCGGCGGGCA